MQIMLNNLKTNTTLILALYFSNIYKFCTLSQFHHRFFTCDVDLDSLELLTVLYNSQLNFLLSIFEIIVLKLSSILIWMQLITLSFIYSKISMPVTAFVVYLSIFSYSQSVFQAKNNFYTFNLVSSNFNFEGGCRESSDQLPVRSSPLGHFSSLLQGIA